jgi:G3E family GTPase
MMKTELYLVTGFLGSGKTTLLNRLLAFSWEGRSGVVVNDFGATGIDASLIQRGIDSAARARPDEHARPEIVEVNNGSIFCSCRADSFVTALESMAAHKPSRVFVEASGMADPSGLARMVDEAGLSDRYRIRAAVCVVDAGRVPKLRHGLMAIDRQIAAADLILINKIDTASAEAIDDLERAIRSGSDDEEALNPDALIVRTSHAQVSRSLLERIPPHRRRATETSHDTPSNRPASLDLDPAGISREQLHGFLDEHVRAAYRIKGWVHSDEEWWYLSDNGGQLQWEQLTPPDGTAPGLTVITSPHRAVQMQVAWHAMLETPEMSAAGT